MENKNKLSALMMEFKFFIIQLVTINCFIYIPIFCDFMYSNPMQSGLYGFLSNMAICVGFLVYFAISMEKKQRRYYYLFAVNLAILIITIIMLNIQLWVISTFFIACESFFIVLLMLLFKLGDFIKLKKKNVKEKLTILLDLVKSLPEIIKESFKKERWFLLLYCVTVIIFICLPQCISKTFDDMLCEVISLILGLLIATVFLTFMFLKVNGATPILGTIALVVGVVLLLFFAPFGAAKALICCESLSITITSILVYVAEKRKKRKKR